MIEYDAQHKRNERENDGSTMEAYVVGMLAMAIWGRAEDDTTYFRNDHQDRPTIMFSVTLEAMCNDGPNHCSISQAVTRMSGPTLFWHVPTN